MAVSAVVLIPDGKPPAGGWPVIAWAHEFSGAARQCAPSLMKNLAWGRFSLCTLISAMRGCDRLFRIGR